MTVRFCLGAQSKWRGVPNGKVPVSKTGGRKPLQVRVLSSPPMILKNKVIVITGGSQGFGKGLAKAFQGEKASIIISSNDKESLELTAKELSVDYFLADVTSYEDIKNLSNYERI